MDFTTFRTELGSYLTGALPLLDVGAPVVPFLPDDVAELPCVVIGRPAVVVTEGVMSTFTLTVDGVGRRVNDEDAQAELDALADGLLAALSVVPPNMRLVAIDPQVTAIAGVEYPTVRALVACDARITCQTPEGLQQRRRRSA